MEIKDDQGFVTFAQNSTSVDYLELAYLQALNVKATQKINKYAVIVDYPTSELVTDKHRQVFDYVIKRPLALDYPMTNEWKVYWDTPFKETIKLESDLLFTRSIDHWWDAFRFKKIVFSTGCRTYTDKLSPSRHYRQFVDDNDLPDVYNGLMYFRYSQEAYDFFQTARMVYLSWTQLQNTVLKNCREDVPSTDFLYAVTAEVFGREQCTMPSMDFINFVHMKSKIQGWNDGVWYETVMSERDGDIMRINNLNQYHPVHYYDKSYATPELIKYYEQRLGIN